MRGQTGETGGPVVTTIDTGWPLDIGLGGEHVVSLTGESHVPLVEVVFEPGGGLRVEHLKVPDSDVADASSLMP